MASFGGARARGGGAAAVDAVMGGVGGLEPEEEFELFAPLGPLPLYQVLGAQGFSHVNEALGGGDYRVIFRREEA